MTAFGVAVDQTGADELPAGWIINETLHYAAKKQAGKAYATGYDKEESDAVKQQ